MKFTIALPIFPDRIISSSLLAKSMSPRAIWPKLIPAWAWAKLLIRHTPQLSSQNQQLPSCSQTSFHHFCSSRSLMSDREFVAHPHSNLRLHLRFRVGIDVVLHLLLLSECSAICGSLECCQGIFFFNRIIFSQEHDAILRWWPSSLGFRGLTVLG